MSQKDFDAERAFDKMFKYMVDMDERINDQISAEIGSVKNQLNTLQNSMDYLVGEYKTLTDEQTAIAGAHIRIDNTLDDHERRLVEHNKQIAKLERVAI